MRLIGGLVFLGFAVTIFTGYYFRHRTVHVEQPIEFNHHKHHVELGMECEFCHQYVSNNAVAGLPGAEVCATCHEEGVQSDNPRFLEVARIASASLAGGESIGWARMYELPAHVIFSHERHLSAHVECSECHGQTGTSLRPMAEPYRISMESCMECHEKRRASLDCLTCHK